MDYTQAIKYIEDLALLEQKRPSLPSLKRIQAFLSYYDQPQDSFKSFHVAGTNGKGSTVAMLDSILRQGNFKVGRFTGPHLLRLNERFCLNGIPIPDPELVALVSGLKNKSEQFAFSNSQYGALSWFEFLTAMAFFYFAQSNIDVAVVEVGLGGRFDATNVLQKLYATAITNIGLDHQNILGSTLEEIAMEKSGIIKAYVPVITAAGEPALSVITKRASELSAKLINSKEKSLEKSPAYLYLLPAIKKIKNKFYSLGLYQYQNALTAICMLNEADFLNQVSSSTAYGGRTKPASNQADKNMSKFTLDNALEGLQNFNWPGRFQIIESEQIILDVAHNPAGIKALRESLEYLFPNHKFHFIFGCYHDKDGLIMLLNLIKPGDSLYLVSLSGKRSFFPLSLLAEHAKALGANASAYADISQALEVAQHNRKNDEYIVATGSFLTVKALMNKLGWTNVQNPSS